METTLFEVKTQDGRIFRVFCANRKQKERFIKVVTNTDHVINVITSGIHNIKQFEQIIKTLN